jgi:signal transduction histidine kinase
MKTLENRSRKVLIGFYFSLILLSGVVLTSCSKTEEALDRNKELAVAYVHSYAVSIGAAVVDITGEAERIAYIRRAIDPISFYPDSSGYLFVYDYDCNNIAHARQKNLQGTSLYDYTDSKGMYVVREMVALSETGGGFITYWWIKPGETGEKEKLGYVEPIPNTNYFIGTGVYLE